MTGSIAGISTPAVSQRWSYGVAEQHIGEIEHLLPSFIPVAPFPFPPPFPLRVVLTYFCDANHTQSATRSIYSVSHLAAAESGLSLSMGRSNFLLKVSLETGFP